MVAALAALGAGLVTGWAAGMAWGVAAAVTILAAVLLGHVRQLAALVVWLRNPTPETIPEGSGPWGEAYSALYRFARGRDRERHELLEAFERFKRAGQAMPDGVVMLDASNHIEWGNAQALRHFGLDPGRDVGQPIANLIRHPDFHRYLETGSFVDPLLFRSDRTSGLVLSVQLVPYGDNQKLLLSRDVTEIERVAIVRRDFVANVSHELKTPLTVVAGYLETIIDLKPGPDDLARYLATMQGQTRNMQRLVEDLLTLSQLESAQNPPQTEEIDVHALMLALREEAESLSGGKHVLEVECEPGAAILGAEQELRSAFGNLVSNAVRYTPAGGTVHLDWRFTEVGGVFSVQDSGIGIDPAHVPRLTERFYRVDRGRSRETGGTGLGLAIVKHVLIRHQAALTVDSEPGRGSCFSVHFPPEKILRRDLAA